MSKILVECTEEFVHGPYNLIVGQKAMMDKHLAENDLKRFVRPVEDDEQEEKTQDASQLNKMMPESESSLGNGHSSPVESPPSEPAASSASPVDQASPQQTAKPPKSGVTIKRAGR